MLIPSPYVELHHNMHLEIVTFIHLQFNIHWIWIVSILFFCVNTSFQCHRIWIISILFIIYSSLKFEWLYQCTIRLSLELFQLGHVEYCFQFISYYSGPLNDLKKLEDSLCHCIYLVHAILASSYVSLQLLAMPSCSCSSASTASTLVELFSI